MNMFMFTRVLFGNYDMNLSWRIKLFHLTCGYCHEWYVHCHRIVTILENTQSTTQVIKTQ